MRNLVAVALVLTTALVSLAAMQQAWHGQQACERPQERWKLSLHELKEDGVIRVTEKSYDPWHVTVTRFDDETVKLLACRDEALSEDCYVQEYMRSFGSNITRTRTE